MRQGKSTEREVERVAPPAKPEVKAETPPSYVSVESFNAFANEMKGMMTGIAASSGRNAAPVVAAPVIDQGPSPDEIEAAYETGDPKLIRKVEERRQQASERRLEARLLGRVNQLESTGLTAMESLAFQAALPQMKYYDRFKKEIDAQIAQLPPEHRIKKEVYTALHAMVVGNHMEEIEAETTTRTRQTYEADVTENRVPGIRAHRVPGDGQADVASVEEFFGEEAANFLASAGRDEETFARKMGYKSHADRIQKLSDFQRPPPPWEQPAGSTMKSLRKAAAQ